MTPVTLYVTIKYMIKSFKHKGLKIFFETGNTKGIQAEHAKKIRRILAILDEIVDISEINFDSYNLHQLKGDLKGLWSMRVNGNWRITFEFKDQDVYIVDYQDYH